MTTFKYMSEFVESVAKEGFTILCASNGKTLRTSMCPKCNRRKQVILLSKKGKNEPFSHEFRACPCGHRETC